MFAEEGREWTRSPVSQDVDSAGRATCLLIHSVPVGVLMYEEDSKAGPDSAAETDQLL